MAEQSFELTEIIDLLQSRWLLLQVNGEIKGKVSGIEIDSRKVKESSIFTALKGTKLDGRIYAPEAAAKGASAILIEGGEDLHLQCPTLVVNDISDSLHLISAFLYQSNLKEKISIGITGTNGKTSVAYLAAQALAHLKGSAIYAGTLGICEFKDAIDTIEFIDTAKTSPNTIEFHRYVGKHPEAKAVVTEVTSIALEQRRLEALELDVAVFTNLTRDHLDYHGSMERYLESKKLLFFRDLKRSRKQNRVAVINLDDKAGRDLFYELQKDGAKVSGFSTAENPEASISLRRVSLTSNGTDLAVSLRGEELFIQSALVGRYNVENLICVAAILDSVGASLEEIHRALGKVTPVPGRLESVKISKDLPIGIVDYAHTPDALEKAISSIRELTNGKVVTVFGCGGDRDRGKRPIMGEIASRLSDMVFVTSDNPRTETPEAIIGDILQGVPVSDRHRVSVNSDRREAIREALSAAGPGDLVLVAGKGHEPYQEVHGVRYPFSDQEVVKEALQNLI